MPIEVGIWRLGDKIERITFSPMGIEVKLEDILATDISILDPNFLLIGRQVPTPHGKFIDLLVIDSDGNLIVIELKRDKTPREVVAQILDYGSWVRQLENEDIAKIFDEYIKKYLPALSGKSLDEIFCDRFNVKEMPEELNEGHELVVVASELDESTERIINYLSDEYGVAINVLFFRFFKDSNNEYLSRVWLIDPGEAEENIVEKRGEEPWNGEYYVSFGEYEDRRWNDAVKHGYIAAGGGAWYSRTLEVLEPGSRIWVNIPGRGYAGVAIVEDKYKPITEFIVTVDSGKKKLISEVVQNLPNPNKAKDELEYFVQVKWIKTVPQDQAIKEKGFFGNQNSVAKPKSKKWIHTIDRLKSRWNIQE